MSGAMDVHIAAICRKDDEIAKLQHRISALEAVAKAAEEWFGPSLQDARFETVAVIKALREAGYLGEQQ